LVKRSWQFGAEEVSGVVNPSSAFIPLSVGAALAGCAGFLQQLADHLICLAVFALPKWT